MTTAAQNIVGPEFLVPIVHRDVNTIKRDVSRRPESLPPRLVIPGSSKPLWVEADIWEWVNSCRVKKAAPPRDELAIEDQPVKRKRGRPRKLPSA